MSAVVGQFGRRHHDDAAKLRLAIHPFRSAGGKVIARRSESERRPDESDVLIASGRIRPLACLTGRMGRQAPRRMAVRGSTARIMKELDC